MKNLIFVTVLLLSGMMANTQEVIGDVYAEFYSNNKNCTYFTNTFAGLGYSGIMGLESLEDTIPKEHSGYQIKLIFVNYNDSLRLLHTSAFNVLDDGLLRLRIWDTKLYGYCYIAEKNYTVDRCILTLVLKPNVPQRKKLLFKDSPTLRMNSKYPWLGN